MPARFHKCGDPAHDAERQGLQFLVDGLPEQYTVYGNPWLVTEKGVIYELDAIVVAPHALYVVELKAFRGAIEGTDQDWWIPERVRSPLLLNRKTAQELKSRLRSASYLAGQVWVEGFVFLTATTNVGVRGPASNDRVHTRKTILSALQDPELLRRLSNGRPLSSSDAAASELQDILARARREARQPARQIRSYRIEATQDNQEAYTELLAINTLASAAPHDSATLRTDNLLATHTLTNQRSLLRIYTLPPLASPAQAEQIKQRARWEAQVLQRLGNLDGVLHADPPFESEEGYVLPLEFFDGITLTSWLGKYGPEAATATPAGAPTRATLEARVGLWRTLARTIDEAHQQGVVHRLLRPEVILVEDNAAPTQVRITGFDLAKQLSSDTTVAWSMLHDERLVYAAPEVVNVFSDAEPASDQFSLGALLALLLVGRPLFESTRQFLVHGRPMRRVRDVAPRLPLRFDECTMRMLERRTADRYPSLQDAIDEVQHALAPAPLAPPPASAPRTVLDIENLPTGQRIGSDYEILGRLGQGGMAVVYAARHLVSGTTRALKIARPDGRSEDALRDEFNVLQPLRHPNLVQVLDISKMIEGRLTLIMERVSGQTLRQWLLKQRHQEARPPSPTTVRRYAEDLLNGLDYLEQQGITHKDLKPDNLLVGDDRLTIIDFSLAAMPHDALYGGTPLYRDPSMTGWSHATDRYAAALCLFELLAGRHAFDGHVPQPDQPPDISGDDLSPSGLAVFFRKALHPLPAERFSSARMMREGLLRALGEDTVPLPPVSQRFTPQTPLSQTGLPGRAVNALARTQVHTVGELLQLTPTAVRNLHAIGAKTASAIIDFQQQMRAEGLESGPLVGPLTPPLFPALQDCQEPIHHLAMTYGLLNALTCGGMTTIGAVASASRDALQRLPGLGVRRVIQIVGALETYADVQQRQQHHNDHALDGMWEAAVTPLTPEHADVLEARFGIRDLPRLADEVAAALGMPPARVQALHNEALARLHIDALQPLVQFIEDVLEEQGGLLPLPLLSQRLQRVLGNQVVRGEGVVRVLEQRVVAPFVIITLESTDQPLVVRAMAERAVLEQTLAVAAEEVLRLASEWPRHAAESTRRALQRILPHWQGDLLQLATWLHDDVRRSSHDQLFFGLLPPETTIPHVLEQNREGLTPDALFEHVRHAFGADTPLPTSAQLPALLATLGYRLGDDGRIGAPERRSVIAPPALAADPLLMPHAHERSPLEALRDLLCDTTQARTFRMLIAPPEHHREIAESVARALGATFLSFEDAFFRTYDLQTLQRHERLKALQGNLTNQAVDCLFELVKGAGRSGQTFVLGDLALLGVCNALDAPRLLYSKIQGGQYGNWVIVLPGVIFDRQPRFNEGQVIWHLDTVTLPIPGPLPT